jgi:transglutaminase/protease-like cytokinesis protein 3
MIIILLILLLQLPCYADTHLAYTPDYKVTYIDDWYTPTIEEQQELEAEVQAWCRRTKTNNEYDTFIRAKRYISRKVHYEQNDYYCYSAYGALIQGKAVCMGYMLLLRMMLDMKGIESYLIVDWKQSHAYNLARLDGQWYWVDLSREGNIIRACQ